MMAPSPQTSGDQEYEDRLDDLRKRRLYEKAESVHREAAEGVTHARQTVERIKQLYEERERGR